MPTLERKLGRLPSRPHDLRRRLLLRNYTAQLPDPPPVCDWSANIADWRMLKNDELGDCGPAAVFHGSMSKTASTTSLIIPTDDEVVAFYSAAGGYRPGRPWTDGGVNNSDMLSVAQKQGYTTGGQKKQAGPYASIEPGDVATLKRAVYYLHGMLIGCNPPAYWYDNFGPGKVWDRTNSRIDGGHDIWCYGYNADGLLIVTWGKPGTLVTWAGIEQNCDELDAIAEADVEINPATGRTAQGMLMLDWQQAATELTGVQFWQQAA